MGWCQQVLATFFKNLSGESTVGGVDIAEIGTVSHTVLDLIQVSGTRTAFTILDTNGGVGMTNQSIEGLSQLDTVTLKKLDILGKVVTGSVGFLRLEPLELSSDGVDLGLDGGVRGHLHRGNRVDWKRVTVKLFSQFFLFFWMLTATVRPW